MEGEEKEGDGVEKEEEEPVAPFDVEARDTDTHSTALQLAVFFGHMAVVEALVRMGGASLDCAFVPDTVTPSKMPMHMGIAGPSAALWCAPREERWDGQEDAELVWPVRLLSPPTLLSFVRLHDRGHATVPGPLAADAHRDSDSAA